MTHGGILVRRYDLTYQVNGGLSRLATVRMVGNDGETALPTLTFDYAEFNLNALSLVEMEGGSTRPLAETAELNDVDGDGLPDFLVMDPSVDGGRYPLVPES